MEDIFGTSGAVRFRSQKRPTNISDENTIIRILILDTDSGFRKECRKLLYLHNFEVREGPADIPNQLHRISDFKPDLLMMDIPERISKDWNGINYILNEIPKQK